MTYTAGDLKRIRKEAKLTQEEFAEKLGLTREMVSNIETGKNPISRATHLALEKIESEKTSHSKSTLIPLYEDVGSIGGTNVVAESAPVYGAPREFIDAGDLFPGATAAIRHYGDSMKEYTSGCILFLKEIETRPLSFTWGEDYVIEYQEYRVTKRIQRGKEKSCIRAFSTNQETYNDGTLIHEPIDIPIETIRHLFLVLGHIIKRHSSGVVYNKTNRTNPNVHFYDR